MKIPDVIRLKQEQHVQNEKAVLSEVNHPFLIRLFWTHHDECFLYMLMDYVPGGELFSYLRNMGRFNNSTGLFYSAEIVCAIEYLHSKEIVYRDLKPENILLDRDGHIRLTDFGFAKKLVDRYPPFFDDNPFGIYQKILAGKIDFPRHLDFNVKRRGGVMCQKRGRKSPVAGAWPVGRFTRVNKTGIKTLHFLQNGADDVKKHRWFKYIDWDAVPQRKLKPPVVPKVSHEGDTSNFEAYPEDDWKKDPPVPPKDLEMFKNF
ncbi:cAMP-dependent protein kinase catalytic subunit PRKX [Acipenser ruthenus]|uniref:non-specific serine/threonine protein kinase n=1 Tax=Acipenser ruthenus TaxID=7906 RepID=A0A662YWU0_ACIRT|nr:cAMP-dependent protein kinase catalytic subunit PRKX [Acipenser ruthenus]